MWRVPAVKAEQRPGHRAGHSLVSAATRAELRAYTSQRDEFGWRRLNRRRLLEPAIVNASIESGMRAAQDRIVRGSIGSPVEGRSSSNRPIVE
jgi:hypothetical protein